MTEEEFKMGNPFENAQVLDTAVLKKMKVLGPNATLSEVLIKLSQDTKHWLHVTDVSNAIRRLLVSRHIELAGTREEKTVATENWPEQLRALARELKKA